MCVYVTERGKGRSDLIPTAFGLGGNVEEAVVTDRFRSEFKPIEGAQCTCLWMHVFHEAAALPRPPPSGEASKAVPPPRGTGWRSRAHFHQHHCISHPAFARRDVLVRACSWLGSHALSKPCCAGITLLYKLTNKLNQLNCFKFSLF